MCQTRRIQGVPAGSPAKGGDGALGSGDAEARSRSVALIAMVDPTVLLPEITARLKERIGTSDNAVLHGTLLTLAELSRLSRTLPTEAASAGESVRASCFATLDAVRPTVFARSAQHPSSKQLVRSSAPHTPPPPFLSLTNADVGKHPQSRARASGGTAHTAAAEAIASLSLPRRRCLG